MPADTAQRQVAPNRRTALRRLARNLPWTWVALSSVAIASVLLSQYATNRLDSLASGGVGPAPAFATQPLSIQIAFYLHVSFGGVALLVGPFQFVTRLRERHPRVHRALGRAYLVSVAIGAAAAVVMAPFNSAGWVGFFGFGAMAVLWLVSGWNAYRSIRRGDREAHQAWVIRNFALTYAAVTLRLWLGVLITAQLVLFGGDFGDVWSNVYAAVPFLSFLPNLVVAEIMVRRRGLPGLQWAQSSVLAGGSAH